MTSGGVSRPPARGRSAIALCIVLVIGALAVAPSSASADTTVTYGGAGPGGAIGLIGDSTLAGVRWTNSFAPLRRFNFVYNAESCRRTTAVSCKGRDGPQPLNALQTMQARSGQWGNVLVMMTGYNDPGTQFGSAVDAIMAEAARQGIPNVMWMTMRTADVSYVAPGFASSSYTFRDNNRILLQKAQQYGGALQIADWAGYSAGRREWVAADGIHLTVAGATAIGYFIVDQAGQIMNGATVTPGAPADQPADAWITVRRGDRGTQVALIQNALIRRKILGIGADGVFGARTHNALAAFQASVGLPANGIADLATANALGVFGGSAVAEPAPAPAPAPAGWSNVARGARGATVAAIQRAVMNSGIFLRGGADGAFGAYTRAGVITYQQRRGLSANGVVDVATAQAMGLAAGAAAAAPAPAPGPATWSNVAFGARGATVVAIQRVVINSGIFLRGGADGGFGVYTRAAVASFQQARGVPPSGVVDAVTAQWMGLYTPPAPEPPPPTAPPETAAPTTAAPVPETTSPPTAPPETVAPTAPPPTEAPTTVADTTTTTIVPP